MTRQIRIALAGVMGILLAAGGAKALEPKDIVVIYNSRNALSLKVAEYYMHARGIPPENLIAVGCTDKEMIAEEDYRTVIVPAVQKGLADRKLAGGSVKCLVTVWGVPLTIGPVMWNGATSQEMETYEKRLAEVLGELNGEIGEYERLGGGAASTAPASQAATRPEEKLDLQQVLRKLNVAGTAAVARVNALDIEQRRVAMEEMVKLQALVTGINGCLTSFQVPEGPGSEAGYARRNAWQAELRNINEKLQAFEKEKSTLAIRQEEIELQLRARGLVGEAAQLQATIRFLSPEETEASFDNELALVQADQDYPRYRWLPNANDVEYYQTLKRATSLPRPLLVARIDGVSIDQVKQMIDTTLKVEKAGLEGKIYLDARGMHGTDGYAVYDADIRRAAEWLQANATMEVVLDDKPALMQAANCPNAALYCGWYSLNHYLDSCQWVPGAVGYHVASFEMESLHNPKETGWVPNLLKRGFCGTLGAVAEPYLTAFPKPSQFFPLLLSGEFTQGEVWEVTAPTVSWRIGYVGDPLYNPFKVKPRVKVETLKEDTVLRNAFEILRREGQ